MAGEVVLAVVPAATGLATLFLSRGFDLRQEERRRAHDRAVASEDRNAAALEQDKAEFEAAILRILVFNGWVRATLLERVRIMSDADALKDLHAGLPAKIANAREAIAQLQLRQASGEYGESLVRGANNLLDFASQLNSVLRVDPSEAEGIVEGAAETWTELSERFLSDIKYYRS